MPILTTYDGSHTLFSEQYGVTYHSRFGAVTESAHVFIAAGLRFKAVVQQDIAILETGFGTGLNAYMTWLESERRNLHTLYCGLETNPISEVEVAALNYPDLLQVPERAADFATLHQCAWETPIQLSENFTFEKRRTPIEIFQSEPVFDLIYFDAFAPQAQPELWTQEVFARMYAALCPDGALVTYCAQGEFKRRLRRAGFTVETLQGPPGKREMTRAIRPEN